MRNWSRQLPTVTLRKLKRSLNESMLMSTGFSPDTRMSFCHSRSLCECIRGHLISFSVIFWFRLELNKVFVFFIGLFKQQVKMAILKWSKCSCDTKPTSKLRLVLFHSFVCLNILALYMVGNMVGRCARVLLNETDTAFSFGCKFL